MENTSPSWTSHRFPLAVLLIRLVVGGVFLSEGIQKFLYPDERGAGRFAEETPLPAPEFFGYLTGAFEIGCGLLLMFGLVTRAATIPMLVTMVGALALTKVPTLMDEGFWVAAHASRNDMSQLFGLAFLLLVGAGSWSLDAVMTKRKGEPA